MWPSFDVILADQVSVVVPLLKLKRSTKVYKINFSRLFSRISVVFSLTRYLFSFQVVFYCHFPDLLLAQHTTLLRRIYRKPIDIIEELTTGWLVYWLFLCTDKDMEYNVHRDSVFCYVLEIGIQEWQI